MDFQTVGWVLLFCGASVAWSLNMTSKAKQYFALTLGAIGFVFVNFM